LARWLPRNRAVASATAAAVLLPPLWLLLLLLLSVPVTGRNDSTAAAAVFEVLEGAESRSEYLTAHCFFNSFSTYSHQTGKDDSQDRDCTSLHDYIYFILFVYP
jgi:hypothetical protein